jgi:cell division protein FtsW
LTSLKLSKSRLLTIVYFSWRISQVQFTLKLSHELPLIPNLVNLRLLIPFFDPTVKDWSLTARLVRWLTFLWLTIGLFVLLSASYYWGEITNQDGLYYFNRQILFSVISLLIFNVIVHTPLQKILKISQWILFGVLGLLLLVLVMGKTAGGATRWIGYGPIQIQPSELIKPFLVLQGAKLFGRWDRYSTKGKAIWLGIFVIILLSILKQPNLSTTSICAMGLWSIAFAAGLSLRYLAGTAIGTALIAVLSIVTNEYQQDRLSFLNPWAPQFRYGEGFHLIHSLLAIGPGGMWGKGFGMSIQKLEYLKEGHTDFIFAVFAEEFGFVGGILLLIMIMSYATLGLFIASRSRHPVHRLVAVGTTTFIVLQSLINIGVAVGTFPTTGVPLPMFSYGGTSMIASLIQSALLIRVARESAIAPVVQLGRQV